MELLLVCAIYHFQLLVNVLKHVNALWNLYKCINELLLRHVSKVSANRYRVCSFLFRCFPIFLSRDIPMSWLYRIQWLLVTLLCDSQWYIWRFCEFSKIQSVDLMFTKIIEMKVVNCASFNSDSEFIC